jgi:hypothetical protein
MNILFPHLYDIYVSTQFITSCQMHPEKRSLKNKDKNAEECILTLVNAHKTHSSRT